MSIDKNASVKKYLKRMYSNFDIMYLNYKRVAIFVITLTVVVTNGRSTFCSKLELRFEANKY